MVLCKFSDFHCQRPIVDYIDKQGSIMMIACQSSFLFPGMAGGFNTHLGFPD